MTFDDICISPTPTLRNFPSLLHTDHESSPSIRNSPMFKSSATCIQTSTTKSPLNPPLRNPPHSTSPNSHRYPHPALSQPLHILHNSRRALLPTLPPLLHRLQRHPLEQSRPTGPKMARRGRATNRLERHRGEVHEPDILRAGQSRRSRRRKDAVGFEQGGCGAP